MNVLFALSRPGASSSSSIDDGSKKKNVRRGRSRSTSRGPSGRSGSVDAEWRQERDARRKEQKAREALRMKQQEDAALASIGEAADVEPIGVSVVEKARAAWELKERQEEERKAEREREAVLRRERALEAERKAAAERQAVLDAKREAEELKDRKRRLEEARVPLTLKHSS